MRGRIGTQTGIYGSILPGAARLAKLVTISKTAQGRLRWMDHYQRHKNVTLTCRHFAIGRSLFYKWHQRFLVRGIRGLESRSSRPWRVRQPTTPQTTRSMVRVLRTANPEFSKYKLAVILQRDHGFVLSASTIGRIIKRDGLFFPRPVKPKGHPARRIHRHRLPVNLVATEPGQLIEVDVKHLPALGPKRYAFVAIDRVTRQTTVHVASTITSRQAVVAWDKACQIFHLPPQAVLSDNGSENLGQFQELLATATTPQYFARPRTPKDKPYVERVIGSIERECLQWGGVAINLEDQQRVIDRWLEKYHSYRPHQALGYLTPDEYYATLQTAKVSTR